MSSDGAAVYYIDIIFRTLAAIVFIRPITYVYWLWCDNTILQCVHVVFNWNQYSQCDRKTVVHSICNTILLFKCCTYVVTIENQYYMCTYIQNYTRYYNIQCSNIQSFSVKIIELVYITINYLNNINNCVNISTMTTFKTLVISTKITRYYLRSTYRKN